MSTLATITLVTIACAAISMIVILLVDRINIKKAIAQWEAEHNDYRRKDKR